MSQQGVVCGVYAMFHHSGGVLPILAQQWIAEVWGVHSGDLGGGEAAGLCAEDFKCSAPQGQNTAKLNVLRLTITEYFFLCSPTVLII